MVLARSRVVLKQIVRSLEEGETGDLPRQNELQVGQEEFWGNIEDLQPCSSDVGSEK